MNLGPFGNGFRTCFFCAGLAGLCPEQRVAAVSFRHELLAGDLQAGLGEPGSVGSGVGLAPPHGCGPAEPVVLGAGPGVLPGDGEEPAAGDEPAGALDLDVADVHAGHVVPGRGQLPGNGDAAATADIHDLRTARNTFSQVSQPRIVPAGGIIVTTVVKRERVVARADQFNRIGVHEGTLSAARADAEAIFSGGRWIKIASWQARPDDSRCGACTPTRECSAGGTVVQSATRQPCPALAVKIR
jgi:hypothetical protein